METDHKTAADEAAARFVQGSILDWDYVSWLADPDAPLTSQAQEVVADIKGAGGEVGDLIEVTPRFPHGTMVVTQSCDLANPKPERKWVTLCALQAISGKDADAVRKGNSTRHIPVTWCTPSTLNGGEILAADLHLLTTMERSLLVDAKERGRPSEQERRDLAEALGRHFSRPALPPEVDAYLQPMKTYADKYAGKQSARGRTLDAVTEIRILSDPDFDSRSRPWRLELIFVVNPDWLPNKPESARLRQRDRSLKPIKDPASVLDRIVTTGRSRRDPTHARLWRLFIQQWLKDLDPPAGIANKTRFRVVTSLDPNDTRLSDLVDLRHLSTPDPLE